MSRAAEGLRAGVGVGVGVGGGRAGEWIRLVLAVFDPKEAKRLDQVGEMDLVQVNRVDAQPRC